MAAFARRTVSNTTAIAPGVSRSSSIRSRKWSSTSASGSAAPTEADRRANASSPASVRSAAVASSASIETGER